MFLVAEKHNVGGDSDSDMTLQIEGGIRKSDVNLLRGEGVDYPKNYADVICERPLMENPGEGPSFLSNYPWF